MKMSCCRTPKIEKIRQALIELLPSQKDADLICQASNSWLLVHALSNPMKDDRMASTFDMKDIPQRQILGIARSLIYIALCLQQLDPDFDSKKLSFPSPEARMEKCITTVATLITSDDELACSMDGLECVILVGLFHMNAGNPRRAWLLFRRALNIGQLMGIHKIKTTIPGGRAMWCEIMQADRYLVCSNTSLHSPQKLRQVSRPSF